MTIALWLLIIPANATRPASFIPFATQEACEVAREAMVKHSRMLESTLYFCTPSGVN